MSSRTVSNARIAALIGLSTTVCLTGLPAARGHLCIVRQGAESNGVMEAGDQHGAAVAAGDFNGDGYDDLVVGAPFQDYAGVSNVLPDVGQIILSKGSPTGITHIAALQFDLAEFGITPVGGERMGASLAVGYFNNDARADLAIGLPGANGGAGMVIVIYGTP